MHRKGVLSDQNGSRSPEPERQRLLRDLHDGVGPILTGLAFGLRAARNLLPRDQEATMRLLSQLEDELHGAIAELHKLTNHVRPIALEQVSLVAAIREHAKALSSRVPAAGGGPLLIAVHSQGDLSLLTLPVRMAAYRIVCEALTNMARHSRACSCVVRIQLDGDLHLEVVDDGIGIPCDGVPPWSGVGLQSMRERALELHGVWTIERGVLGGTRVAATLPNGVG